MSYALPVSDRAREAAQAWQCSNQPPTIMSAFIAGFETAETRCAEIHYEEQRLWAQRERDILAGQSMANYVLRDDAAQIAECAFDDRPRSRVGHSSHMDWEDGYREGTQAAASAIRAASSASDSNAWTAMLASAPASDSPTMPKDVPKDVLNLRAERAAGNIPSTAGHTVPDALREACEPWADYHGDLPDYDHPLRPVFEGGIQYAVELLAKELGVEDWTPCEGTEEFDGDLGGTLMNIVLAAMPKDEHGDPVYPRDLPAALATTPASDSPAIPEGMEQRPYAYCCAEAGGNVEMCDCANKNHGTAFFSIAQPADYTTHDRAPYGDIRSCFEPTADSPVIPEGMKPWHGGDSAPEDWDGGLVLLRGGWVIDPSPQGPKRWDHDRPNSRPARDIIAYTPKPTPASHTALTEAIDKLSGIAQPSAGVLSVDQAKALSALIRHASVSHTAPDALSTELSDAEAEAALTGEGIYVWGDAGDKFASMFAAAMKARAALATPAPSRDEVERALAQAQFLVDRIDSLDWADDGYDDLVRDWNGHVDPALCRLKGALAALNKDSGDVQ